MCFVSSVPNDTTQWTVRNKYYAVTPAVQAWYDTHADIGLGNLIPLTSYINSKIGADSVSAFTKVDIIFAKSTKNLAGFAEWYWKAPPDGPGKAKANTGFSWGIGYDRPWWDFYLDTLDLAYPTSTQAYTGAWGGFPAGDLNWFPSRKQDWLLTGIGTTEQDIPQAFSLSQNFPNPFNPATKITFALPKAGDAVVKVFNLLGQEIATLVNGKMNAGYHEVTFDASRLASGVYLYSLSSGQFHATKKMLLIK